MAHIAQGEELAPHRQALLALLPEHRPEFWAERRWATRAGQVMLELDHQWNAVTREYAHAAILTIGSTGTWVSAGASRSRTWLDARWRIPTPASGRG